MPADEEHISIASTYRNLLKFQVQNERIKTMLRSRSELIVEILIHRVEGKTKP